MEEKINYRRGNVIILCLCLFIPLVTVTRLLDQDNWITAARKVQWVNEDGSEIKKNPDYPYDEDRCYPVDSSIRGESHIWSYCYSGDKEKKRMVRIDLETKVGTMWYFPEELPLVAIKGLSVGPNEGLAIVYWTDGIPGRLVAGVLDDRGWQIEAKVLPHIKKARFHAMAWVDGKVNIIYSAGRLNPSKGILPRIAKIGPDGIQTKVFSKPDSPSINPTIGYACNFFLKAAVWQGRFAIPKNNGYECLELSENGACHVRPEGFCGDLISDNVVDLAVFGVQQRPLYISDPDEYGKSVFLAQLYGGLSPRPKAPIPGWFRDYYNSWMAPSHGGMKRIPFWTNENRSSYIRPHAEGWMQTSSLEGPLGEYMVIKLLDADGDMTHEKAVTLEQFTYTGDLGMGIPIARRDGGFWMVSASGHYLTLGPDLERLDGRSVWAHLRGRGAWNLRRYEYQHFVKLLWVLLGLPFSILVGWAYARLFKKDLNLAYRASAMVFLVSGAMCLVQLFPLLH